MTVVADVDRDVLLARGPDATTYLQGQLSQDVTALAVGESTFALLLQPQGKVDAWLRVTRIDDEAFALDVDGGWGEPVLARLRRFLLRTKVDFEPVDWDVVAVVEGGPDLTPPPGAWRVVGELGEGGVDLLGPDLGLAEVERLDPAAYEARRIERGVPRMGAELDESTIPAAAGIVERSVSFTKGCYTGQELVARIDSRGGNVPTRLRRLRLDADVVAPPGATVHAGERSVGAVTSSVPGLALAYVGRAVEPPADVELQWSGGTARARVEALG